MIADSNQSSLPLMALLGRLRRCCEEREIQVREETGLSSAEYACMIALSPDGSLGASAVAERMGLSLSRVSRVVDRMVQRALVRRVASSVDRRAVELSLTGEGRRVRAQLDACLRRCDTSIREQLSDGELSLAGKGIDLLLGAME